MLQVGEGGSGEQGGVGEGRWARPAGSADTRGARGYRRRLVFLCYRRRGAVSCSYSVKNSVISDIKHLFFFWTRFHFRPPECTPTAQAQVSACTPTSWCPTSATTVARSRSNASFPRWLLGDASTLLPWRSQEQAGPDSSVDQIKPIRRLPVMCCRSDVTSVFSVIFKVWGRTPRGMAVTGSSTATRYWSQKAEAFNLILISTWTNFRFASPGVHLKRLDGRPGGGRGCDEPWGEVSGARHQSVPGRERHEGLSQGTQVGQDRSKGPGIAPDIHQISSDSWTSFIYSPGSV